MTTRHFCCYLCFLYLLFNLYFLLLCLVQILALLDTDFFFIIVALVFITFYRVSYNCPLRRAKFLHFHHICFSVCLFTVWPAYYKIKYTHKNYKFWYFHFLLVHINANNFSWLIVSFILFVSSLSSIKFVLCNWGFMLPLYIDILAYKALIDGKYFTFWIIVITVLTFPVVCGQ